MSTKRKATTTNSKSSKKRKVTQGGSATYGTVARTRGAYAQGEHKYFDLAVNGTCPRTSNWANTVVDPNPFDTLCVPTQGAGINQRIGREITVHKIRIQGYFQMAWTQDLDMAGGIAAQVIRLLLVQDCQTNATVMGGNELMDGSSANAAVMAYQNVNNFGRFKVLKDKMIVLEDPNITLDSVDSSKKDGNAKVKLFKININFKKGIRMRFNATNGGTVADLVDNSFHLVANARTFGAQDVNQPVISLSYRSRFVYTDN